MCCPLEQTQGVFIPQAIALEEREERKIYHVKGIVERTPRSLTERVLRVFQYLELIEKVAEVVDESFHLVGSLIQRYAPVLIYQEARQLHHAAHDIEHCLHATCFIGDVFRLLTGRYFESDEKEKKIFTYLRNAGRVCHTFAHFLATADFLADLQLYPFGRLEKYVKYAPVLSATGYLCWTVALAWKRKQDHLMSDLGIHLGGCLFESITLVKTMECLASHVYIINKVAAFVGIVQASCVAERLMTPDREEIRGQFEMPVLEKHHDHADHEHPHHGEHAPHVHLHFQPVISS